MVNTGIKGKCQAEIPCKPLCIYIYIYMFISIYTWSMFNQTIRIQISSALSPGQECLRHYPNVNPKSWVEVHVEFNVQAHVGGCRSPSLTPSCWEQWNFRHASWGLAATSSYFMYTINMYTYIIYIYIYHICVYVYFVLFIPYAYVYIYI